MRCRLWHVCLAIPVFGGLFYVLGGRAEYDLAARRGRAAADREIREGQPTIWTIGLLRLDELLDRESGLPRSGLGCVRDNETEGLRDGHNRRILEYIQENGHPAGSFKKHEHVLFNLKEHFEDRARTEAPIALVPDGPEVRSPDDCYGIRLVIEAGPEPDGRSTRWVRMLVSREGLDPEEVSVHGDQIELFFGPPGSNFVVSRETDSRGVHFYSALDLSRVRCLRSEHESSNEIGGR